MTESKKTSSEIDNSIQAEKNPSAGKEYESDCKNENSKHWKWLFKSGIEILGITIAGVLAYFTYETVDIANKSLVYTQRAYISILEPKNNGVQIDIPIKNYGHTPSKYQILYLNYFKATIGRNMADIISTNPKKFNVLLRPDEIKTFFVNLPNFNKETIDSILSGKILCSISGFLAYEDGFDEIDSTAITFVFKRKINKWATTESGDFFDFNTKEQ